MGRRVGLVFVGLIILIIYSVAILMANDIAETNPVIKRILQIKEIEVEKIEVKTEPVYIEKEVEVHWYRFHITGYSACDPSQGTNDVMASGKKVFVGAVAADPTVLLLGTKIEIKGLGLDGEYIVEDVGGLIKGLDIDVYCESKLEALTINGYAWVRIIEE